MIRTLVVALAAVSICAGALATTAAAQALPSGVADDAKRPAADVARDATRKPAEILAFAGVKSGDKVGDLIMGGGYFTRVFAGAVGPQGKVYAFQPSEFVTYRAAYGTEQDTVLADYGHVVKLRSSIGAPAFPEGLDVVFTAQNYHDLHLKPFPADTAAKLNAAVFKALKPGGVFIVIDHHALAGSGTSAADGLHRIDIEAVKAEVQAAGFRLDGESDLLRLPADPRTASVFDASIRGKTDQFILRFRKPG